MALRVRPDRHPFETGIVSAEIFATSQMLTAITGVPVQPNKAIIGRNAFAHEAGIHQDGVVKNPLTYEIMTPHSVGVPNSQLVLGKHSGRHALGRRYQELGFEFERVELDAIYKRFVVLADRIKTVEDHHLLDLLRPAERARQNQAASEPAQVKKAVEPVAPVNAPVPAQPHLPAPPDSKPRTVEPQLMSVQEEKEDYYWGV
jgi:2-isopropylmalate synthase